MRLFYLLLWAFFGVQLTHAAKQVPIPWMNNLERTIVREQVEDISRGVGSQNLNHMVFSTSVFLGDQTYPLSLQNSDLYGYPFQQKLGLSFIFDSLDITHHGLGYYYSRVGWDREDFLFFQPKKDWSLSTQSQTALYIMTVPDWELMLSAGWRGVESEFNHPIQPVLKSTHHWVALADYRLIELSFQGSKSLDNALLSLHPWNSPERNHDFPDWSKWVPRGEYYLDFVIYDNSYWSLQQKIWTEYAFLSLRGNDEDWQALTFNIYLDPMHFFSLNLSALNIATELNYGWLAQLGPLSMGYNDPDLYFSSAGLKSSFFLKIGINISTLMNHGYLSPGGEDVTRGIVEE